MSALFATALTAAREAAGSQHYPQGALYVVATPIGNLADISLRALHVLQTADVIACEDTRHTQALLRAYGIEKPSSQWLAVHQHNEAEAAGVVVARLQTGQRVGRFPPLFSERRRASVTPGPGWWLPFKQRACAAYPCREPAASRLR